MKTKQIISNILSSPYVMRFRIQYHDTADSGYIQASFNVIGHRDATKDRILIQFNNDKSFEEAIIELQQEVETETEKIRLYDQKRGTKRKVQ